MTNLKNYKALILLIMIYLSITLTAGAMVNKTVSIWIGFVQGGAVITPLWYALADIMTEVYGYEISRQILWSSLISQFIFSLLSFLIIHLPSPVFWHGQESYKFVFGNTLRIFFSGMIAYLISGFINIIIISKWKILVTGKYFSLRNITTSLFSEMIYTVLIIPMISLGKLPFEKILIIITSSFLLKLVYAMVIGLFSSKIVKYLKKLEGIDVYDYNINYNPFVFGLSSYDDAESNSTIIDIRKYKTN